MGFSHALPRSVSLSFPSRNSKGIANEYCIATWSDSWMTIPPIKGLTLGFATGTARVGPSASYEETESASTAPAIMTSIGVVS